MINDFISLITGFGVTLQDFTYVCIIIYLFSKPVKKLINKFFGGVNNG